MSEMLQYPEGKFTLDLEQIEKSLYDQGHSAICGVDEVGRGPLAGPVVAAAVIMPAGISIEGVDDSKKLTPARRDKVFQRIAEADLICAVGVIDNVDIDRINIRQASLMAMRKAVMDLKHAPEYVLVDGNALIPKLSFPQLAIVGGDARCQSIAAASIVAKVTRDRIMERYQALYPAFSFAQHKGYPTPAHLAELREHGPCEIHRKTFRPVAQLLDQYALL